MASREDVRHALIERVSRKVSGHGIARRSVEGAVDRVLSAIPANLDAAESTAPQVAVLSAASAPDLPSRVRRVLDRHGARILAMGTGTAGRHTVVTVRLASGSGGVLDRAAAELGAVLSMVDPADAVRFAE